nr:hypothetical protein [Legionella norrlandica]
MLKRILALAILASGSLTMAYADTPPVSSITNSKPLPSSYAPVVINETFQSILQRMSAAKDSINEKQKKLLEQRYDLSNTPSKTTKMTGGKPIQEGVRVKLPEGITWEKLGQMTPEEIKSQGVFPQGFLPLPHPNHGEGGMLFPKIVIDEFKKQEDRDLTRFDLDFDIPEHFLPPFPAPIFLTTRPDLGDVSKGQLVNINNYYELFNGLLNPKQLEGLRLLVTPFPQQQFNQTEDRRTVKPSRGVACFDCHANGIQTRRPIWLATFAHKSFVTVLTHLLCVVSIYSVCLDHKGL